MPIAAEDRTATGAVPALFTSTSAVCVTGLAVVDTGSHWSGFGIMTMASLLALLVSGKPRLRMQLTAQAETKSLGIGDVRRVLLGVAGSTLIVELSVGAALALRFRYGYGATDCRCSQPTQGGSSCRTIDQAPEVHGRHLRQAQGRPHRRRGHNGAVTDDERADEAIPVIRDVDHGTAKLMPDVDRARAWLLTVDGAPQSYVDLDAPTHLEFEYAQRLAHVLDTADDPDRPLDVIHLGGGALTLPRYVAATRPGSRQDVVEADRGLLELVTERLPLLADSGITVHGADARGWLEAAAPDSTDVLVADVFGGSRVPAHLTSVAYARAAERVLRAGGVYAANLADGAPFGFLRSQLATFAEVFGEVALIAEPTVLRGRRFGNAVLVASHEAIEVEALARRAAGDIFPARVEYGAALRRFIGAAKPVRDEDAVASPEPPDGAFSIG